MWITVGALLGMLTVSVLALAWVINQLDLERRAHQHTAAMRRVAEAQLSSALAATLRDSFDRNRQRVSEAARVFDKAVGDGHGAN